MVGIDIDSTIFKVTFSLVILFAVSFQVFLKDVAYVYFATGRPPLQAISDFPYQCRKLHDERLQGCEDMWLSERTRTLFLACSNTLGRAAWQPNIHRFNLTTRSQYTADAVIAMSIDTPAGNGYEYTVLSTPGYTGTAGDGILHLVGMTGTDDPTDNSIDLLLVNGRPHINQTTGQIASDADQERYGGNSTIERFRIQTKTTKKGGKEVVSVGKKMTHVKTYAHERIATPNNVAAVGKDGFFITNDHGSKKAGLFAKISPAWGSGNLVYCTSSATAESGTVCKFKAGNFKFPNGLITTVHPWEPQLAGAELQSSAVLPNRIYIPSSLTGMIHVYDIFYGDDTSPIDPRDVYVQTTDETQNLPLSYHLDNLSLDPHTGEIYAAAIPDLKRMMEGFDTAHPSEWKNAGGPPSTVLRFQWLPGAAGQGRGAWQVKRMLEDRDGAVLPAGTSAVVDHKTGRIFIGGVYSPFITVCEPKEN